MNTASRLPRVMMVCEAFAPAARAGGGCRSLVNAVARLGDRFDFSVLTRNHDWGDARPFADLPADRWLESAQAAVFYGSSRRLTTAELRRRVRERDPQVIYLNSVFSSLAVRILLLRRAGRLRGRGVVVAPEGELGPGALDLKARRKRLYLRIGRGLGLFRGVSWKAASEREAEHIRHWFGAAATVFVAANLAAPPPRQLRDEPRAGPADELQLVFLARLHPKKNLLFLIEALRGVRGKVHLGIAGPTEDAPYWERCQRSIASLPANVRVSVYGAVAPDRVDGLLRGFDVFALPTRDENFGHAIREALAAGCFVLLSPDTPWTDVELEGVGRLLPLGDVGPWSVAIDALATSSGADVSRRRRVMAYGARQLADDEAERRFERLLVDTGASVESAASVGPARPERRRMGLSG